MITDRLMVGQWNLDPRIWVRFLVCEQNKIYQLIQFNFIPMEPMTGIAATVAKVVAAAASAMFFIQSNRTSEAIFILAVIVLLDTALGTLVAIKLQKFSSWGMSRFAKKITTYAITLLTAHCAAVVVNFGFDAIYFVATYLIVTEAISNFEKLHILGVPIPEKILVILNADFTDRQKSVDRWIEKVDGMTPEPIKSVIQQNTTPSEDI